MLSLLPTVLLAALPALDVPRNDGWVTDLAGVLSDAEEASLENLMESYRTGTSHEIALLTIPSLEGESLEGFTLEVARTWGIGGEDANNGALLLVAVGDRKMRIEVGRGLEGNLTDSISGRIIRDVITPEFKRGSYPDGIRGGIEAMHAAIGGDYGPINRSRGGKAAGGSLGGCFSSLFFLMFFGMLLGNRRRHMRGGLGGMLPWLVLGSLGSGGRGGGGGLGGGGGFGGFGGGGGFSGGGASGGW